MIEIDGSLGEGGGQVLRTSLALSTLTHQPISIINIRARRSNPGLAAQHVKAVEAAASICGAMVEGASAGSSRLTFAPGPLRSGHYRFIIPTAGAATLVLQTVFIPLCLAQSPSTVFVSGGTHVPWSPCFEYLEQQWLPTLTQMGMDAQIELQKAGFYPPGGGGIIASIKPVGELKGLQIVERGALQRIRGNSVVANLKEDIARREKHQALRRLEPICRDTKIEIADVEAPSPGNFILLSAQFEKSRAVYFSLGEIGKRAERVADEAVDQLLEFLETDGAIDQYLADQMLLPLALASSPSEIRTSKVTHHLLTNAEIIRLFLPAGIFIDGELGQPATIRIIP